MTSRALPALARSGHTRDAWSQAMRTGEAMGCPQERHLVVFIT